MDTAAVIARLAELCEAAAPAIYVNTTEEARRESYNPPRGPSLVITYPDQSDNGFREVFRIEPKAGNAAALSALWPEIAAAFGTKELTEFLIDQYEPDEGAGIAGLEGTACLTYDQLVQLAAAFPWNLPNWIYERMDANRSQAA